MDNVQVTLSVGIPTLAVLVGILLNSRQTDQLRAEMNQRFNDLHRILDARFGEQQQALLRVEGVLDARLKHVEEKVS